MIFISLIAVGFITIVVEDQRQALNNDLSASALASARSGVEDGKRILLYCQSHPGDANCTDDVLNSQGGCNLLTSGRGSALATTLGMNVNAEGEGMTGTTGSEEYMQHYTCLTIQTKTPSATSTLTADADYIQQLKTVDSFNRLQVTWTGMGSSIRSGSLANWPVLTSWGNEAPVLQFQVIPFTLPLNDLNMVESAARTLYIVPCTGALCTNTSPNISYDARAATGSMRGSDIAPISYAQCTSSGGFYSCTTTLNGFSGGNPSGTQYYVRVALLYGSTTDLTLAARNSAGQVVLFDNVQPWIDSTGRTNDAFRRVRAEVSYAQPTVLPRHALDSAAPICKDMVVTLNNGTNNCN